MTLVERTVIGVVPRQERARRCRLFDVLGQACDVTFEGRDSGEHAGLDAAVVFDDTGEAAGALARAGVPCLVAPAAAPDLRAARPETVRFSASSLVDERLRDRALQEDLWPSPTLAMPEGAVALASVRNAPVWTLRHEACVPVQQIALAPAELATTDRLKYHLEAGRFFGLAVLVHFLRQVTGAGEWRSPPRRACFVLDDLNLHWPSYGYVRYGQLAAHAAEHGYHVAIGMVALDAALAHPRAVATFRDSPALSLAVHGNDHLRREMAQPVLPSQALAIVAQALRRFERFERRHGLVVDRVMIPPQGSATLSVMRAMLLTGFEGITHEGPVGSGADDPLIGWHPADLHLADGLPSFNRHVLACPEDESLLRSFLDQPLILAGHHDDLAPSLDRLAARAEAVNKVDGDVRWMSLSCVARSNYLSRRRGSTLEVSAFARLLDVAVPDGVDTLVVRLPGAAAACDDRVVVSPAAATPPADAAGVGDAVPVAGGSTVRVGLVTAGAVPPGDVPAPPWRAWPIVRRCLATGRDRLKPFLYR